MAATEFNCALLDNLSFTERGGFLLVEMQKQAPDVAAILYALKKGADLNARTKEEETPLLLAARNGHDDLVVKMLDAGADINQKDLHGSTAILKAVCSNYKEIIDILIARNALLEERTTGNQTPLSIAALHGYTDTACQLIRAGANADAPQGHKNNAYECAYSYPQTAEAMRREQSNKYQMALKNKIRVPHQIKLKP